MYVALFTAMITLRVLELVYFVHRTCNNQEFGYHYSYFTKIEKLMNEVNKFRFRNQNKIYRRMRGSIGHTPG